MRAVPLLMIITVASAEIYGAGEQAASIMNKDPKKNWWGSIILKPVPGKTIPEDIRKSLYQMLSRYPQFSSFHKETEEKQSFPILATIIGTRIGRRKLGTAGDKTRQNDDHAIKTRALLISFICPSDTVKLHGKCKPKPQSNIFDYDDYYSQFFDD